MKHNNIQVWVKVPTGRQAALVRDVRPNFFDYQDSKCGWTTHAVACRTWSEAVRNQISPRIVCIIQNRHPMSPTQYLFENMRVICAPSFSTRTKNFKNRTFVN